MDITPKLALTSARAKVTVMGRGGDEGLAHLTGPGYIRLYIMAMQYYISRNIIIPIKP